MQLSATADAVKNIKFQTRAANTGQMFIGLVTVASTLGWQLSPEVAGRARTVLEMDFGKGSALLSLFYVDGSVNGEIIDWVAILE